MNYDFTKSGKPFRGREKDLDKQAKMDLLKKAVEDLSKSAFVKEYTITDGPENRNAQILITFPDVITFNGERKGKLPAILNLADNYTFVKLPTGFRLTVTILDLWKE